MLPRRTNPIVLNSDAVSPAAYSIPEALPQDVRRQKPHIPTSAWSTSHAQSASGALPAQTHNKSSDCTLSDAKLWWQRKECSVSCSTVSPHLCVETGMACAQACCMMETAHMQKECTPSTHSMTELALKLPLLCSTPHRSRPVPPMMHSLAVAATPAVLTAKLPLKLAELHQMAGGGTEQSGDGDGNDAHLVMHRSAVMVTEL